MDLSDPMSYSENIFFLLLERLLRCSRRQSLDALATGFAFDRTAYLLADIGFEEDEDDDEDDDDDTDVHFLQL